MRSCVKFFVLVLVLVSVSATQQLRFLSSKNGDIVGALKTCQGGDIKACTFLQSRNFGGSDNGNCASLPLTPGMDDWVKDRFSMFCEMKDACYRTTSTVGSLAVVQTITRGNMEGVLNSLPASTNSKIGAGSRREMMDVEKYGAWACQTWAQLSHADSKKVFGADAFVFDSLTDTCLLIKSDGSSMESGNNGKGSPSESLNGTKGLRSCNCRDNEDIECKALDSEVTSECKKDPSAAICKTVDSTDRRIDPGFCAALGGSSCVGSEDIAKKCFVEAKGAILPAQRKTMGPSKDDVRNFLTSAGKTFWDFAGKVGFTSDPNSEVGPQTKTYIPSLAGEFACRAVLQLVDTNGKNIENIDMFLYDSATETCHFFLETDFNDAQTPSDSFIIGKDFC